MFGGILNALPGMKALDQLPGMKMLEQLPGIKLAEAILGGGQKSQSQEGEIS